ncbi:hypothetical protein FKP32DRAFT_1672383 [Trametes sanguinea]|nr:hypothetical protein FKP32DRAFT_1672383 [Trametes sanguinea]
MAQAALNKYNCLRDGYLRQLDASERDAVEAGHPLLLQAYRNLEAHFNALYADVGEWADHFRAVLSLASPDSCDKLMRERRFCDPGTFYCELGPLFQVLVQFLQERQELRGQCIELSKNMLSSLESRSGGRIAMSELRTHLKKHEDLKHGLFTSSVRQTEVIRSIEMLVGDATLHASAIYTAIGRITLEKITATFHRYDEMRVSCSDVVARSAQFVTSLEEHTALLEGARDWQ